MTSLRTALHTSIALSLAVALGCEIDIGLGDLDEASTSGDAGSTAASSLEGTGAVEGTGIDVAESTGIGDTSGSTGLDSGDTETPACLPEPESIFFDVDFDPEAFPESGEVVVDAECVIQGVAEDGDVRTYAIECDEDGVAVPHELVVRRSGSSGPIDLPLAVGTPIHLQAYRAYPIDGLIRRYVAVRDAAGELVLAWNNDGSPPSNLGFDVEAWFAPLTYALAFGDCEPEPYEEPGTVFIVDPCPSIDTRLAVDFQLGDESIHLLDGISGQLGPLSLHVTDAWHYEPVGEDTCGASDSFGFVAFREK